MFDWKWYLSDLVQDKPVTVFSTFSCGGGSSMGYKRAGFNVVGNVEIDPRVNEIYKKNNHPKYNYLMDLRDFNKIPNDDLPDELFHLDILDGSPPCSTFSTAGKREKGWGVEKVFREGQKRQRLDDLFFVFLDTVEKLKPKVVVAENVTGIIKANARGYCTEIINRFRELGYDVQVFKLNAAVMDVPQARERVFFIANNQKYPKLNLKFNGTPIRFGTVRSQYPGAQPGEKIKNVLSHRQPTDLDLSSINLRLYGKYTMFTSTINWDNRVAFTLTASGSQYRGCDGTCFTTEDCRNVSTFPQDYDFGNQQAQYICGMSVPPNMTAHIAEEIWKQWLRK